MKEEKLENGGTSTYALEFLSNWLNKNSKTKGMNIKCKVLPKEEISIYNKELEEAIKNNGVAILRVYQEEHYSLLTKLDDEYAYIFDPYYLNISHYENDEWCEIIKDRPFEFNRKIKKERLEEKSTNDFALVSGDNKEIIIINRADN